jgi:hypothetical protein
MQQAFGRIEPVADSFAISGALGIVEQRLVDARRGAFDVGVVCALDLLVGASSRAAWRGPGVKVIRPQFHSMCEVRRALNWNNWNKTAGFEGL